MSVSDLLTVNALTGPGPDSKVTGCSGVGGMLPRLAGRIWMSLAPPDQAED